jgi:predicted RND superfamily exporter protein
MIKNGQSRDTGNTGHTRYKTMTIKTKQTKNNKQKRKNTNTIQKAKKISNMDPTKNNKGYLQCLFTEKVDSLIAASICHQI